MNSSNKKPDSEASALKKKVNKGKTEGSENSDLDKTPPPSPAPEEDEDPGVQKRRSSRQVKRKRYTEDLEFKISDEEADDADAAGRDSPSNTSQSEQQVGSQACTVARRALLDGLARLLTYFRGGLELLNPEAEQFSGRGGL